jgi:hypothetical protein
MSDRDAAGLGDGSSNYTATPSMRAALVELQPVSKIVDALMTTPAARFVDAGSDHPIDDGAPMIVSALAGKSASIARVPGPRECGRANAYLSSHEPP